MLLLYLNNCCFCFFLKKGHRVALRASRAAAAWCVACHENNNYNTQQQKKHDERNLNRKFFITLLFVFVYRNRIGHYLLSGRTGCRTTLTDCRTTLTDCRVHIQRTNCRLSPRRRKTASRRALATAFTSARRPRSRLSKQSESCLVGWLVGWLVVCLFVCLF